VADADDPPEQCHRDAQYDPSLSVSRLFHSPASPEATPVTDMNEELLAKIRSAKIAALNLSRDIPTRPCSPYGAMVHDTVSIKRTAREAFEALHAAEQELLPGPTQPD
jgi:hypothetical protein